MIWTGTRALQITTKEFTHTLHIEIIEVMNKWSFKTDAQINIKQINMEYSTVQYREREKGLEGGGAEERQTYRKTNRERVTKRKKTRETQGETERQIVKYRETDRE